LFEGVVQKSDRTISKSSFDSRPSAPIIVTDDLRPNGGFVSTTEYRDPGSAVRESFTSISDGPSGFPIPCSSRFIAAKRAVPSTSSTPRANPSVRWARTSGVNGPACSEA